MNVLNEFVLVIYFTLFPIYFSYQNIFLFYFIFYHINNTLSDREHYSSDNVAQGHLDE